MQSDEVFEGSYVQEESVERSDLGTDFSGKIFSLYCFFPFTVPENCSLGFFYLTHCRVDYHLEDILIICMFFYQNRTKDKHNSLFL